ncbi:AcrR family transcriptional regulator [Actinoalloteichus hoggarensis]|uniref:Transcriptional regulator BetI n=1 Tax=Actinoalloteichus hoggarensis TaxID=1470176 RepID=A0A221W359_9PSEU|nr:TetR/AcrR family transcriptional regulator [Actinoalloteichus hoggarensis]ASO20218.1 transcriptional regulator BetI [Actinoalloteichus hoggarensis]MBB5919068.1 AcrR family transcriptional regulator [Actinoalloteichus hoggarensis]
MSHYETVLRQLDLGQAHSGTMCGVSSTKAGFRNRTRQAIIDAAGAVLGERPYASMSEIAEAAEVGRSTLHRYFSDRGELIGAMSEDLLERLDHAIIEAELDQGPPREALRRLLHGYYDIGPRVMFVLNELHADCNEAFYARFDAAGIPVERLLERGRAAGDFDDAMNIDWVRRMLWYLLSAAWDAVAKKAMSRHAAVDSVVRTLEQGILGRGRA